MAETTRIKLNLRNGEIEIEGSEAFVEKQIENLETLLELIRTNKGATLNLDEGGDTGGEGTGTSDDNGIPSTFGEWMHLFKTDLNDLDKALITARYVQHESQSNDFKTAEINKSLKDHGIKLANPSATLKRLISKKYLFQTRKIGKLIYMRLSVDGQKYLDSIKANG